MPFVATLAEDSLLRVEKDYVPELRGIPVHLKDYLHHAFKTLLVRCLFGKPLRMAEDKLAAEGHAITSGKLTAGKVDLLLGHWAQLVDEKAPALGFSRVTGLDKFVEHLVRPEDTFALPRDERAAAEPASASEPAAATSPPPPAGSGSSQWSVGQIVCVTRRVTIDMPLPTDPDFRKDLRVGTRGKILEVHPSGNKLKINAEVMHNGEHHEVTAFVAANKTKLVARPAGGPGEATPDGEVLDPDAEPVPACIREAHPTDHVVAWVDDWSNLVEDSSPSAMLHWTKAGAQIAMQYVLARVPTLDEEDLGVVHRSNAHGAKHVEVWTLRAFKAGEIILAPVTAELKTRMYTHNASVRVQTPDGAVPDNKLLALDGRGKTHLSHGCPEQHEPVATGSLFWSVERTSKAAEANLTLHMTNVYIPEIKVTIPGLPQHTTHLKKDGGFPCVPVLRNTKALKEHTRLVALSDPMVAAAAEKEQRERHEERLKEERAKKKPRRT